MSKLLQLILRELGLMVLGQKKRYNSSHEHENVGMEVQMLTTNTETHLQPGSCLTSALAEGKQSKRLPTIYSIQTGRWTDRQTDFTPLCQV